MTNKTEYIQFCITQKDLPLFMQANWLNAVSNNWDVAIHKQNDKIVAVLPYTSYNKNGFLTSTNPPLTPYLGIWIKHPKKIKIATKLGNEKEIFQNLISQLPHFDTFNYNFNPNFTNWYPLYLKKFTQTTRYTYTFKYPFNSDDLFNNFKSKLKSHILKAEKSIQIIESTNIDELIKLKKATKKIIPSIPLFKVQIYQAVFDLCKSQNLGTQLIAKTEEKTIGSILLVWDAKYCYLLHGASDPTYKMKNAMSLLIWEAIKIAEQKRLSFNFEGSMVESIEQFFRFFNATQTPYYNISKTNSKIKKIKTFINTF